FYIESHRIATEAQFIIDSLPNAEIATVEQIVQQLDAIRDILLHIDDNLAEPDELEDVRKDCLEFWRQLFMDLEDEGLLDMENEVHRVCLFLVFEKRIQASLDRAREAWNHHKLRTERNRPPIALYELSREQAILQGYWTGDPGDPVEDVRFDPGYGIDGDAPVPPADERHTDPTMPSEEPVDLDEESERAAGIALNTNEELERAREVLFDFNFEQEDEDWGKNVYMAAI
ncbi:hypothetical protein DICSQDRAFT_44550, partial [Dichomitus squalens LYAD-421 SS1]